MGLRVQGFFSLALYTSSRTVREDRCQDGPLVTICSGYRVFEKGPKLTPVQTWKLMLRNLQRRTHFSRTLKKPEYLTASNLLKGVRWIKPYLFITKNVEQIPKEFKGWSLALSEAIGGTIKNNTLIMPADRLAEWSVVSELWLLFGRLGGTNIWFLKLQHVTFAKWLKCDPPN